MPDQAVSRKVAFLRKVEPRHRHHGEHEARRKMHPCSTKHEQHSATYRVKLRSLSRAPYSRATEANGWLLEAVP